MIGNAEQDEFIRSHKYAVITTLRATGHPSNSVVFTFAEGDELVFSTTADRFKAVSIGRDDRVAITLLDEGEPHRFITVEGKASIQRDGIVPFHTKVYKFMRGADWEPDDGFEEELKKAGRLLIRIKAERVSGVLNR